MAKRTPPPPFQPTKELLGLQRYDAMVKAIAECQQFDDVVDLHDKAKALEVYAKQAKNYESELRALDIRLRASQRAGQLLHEGQKNGTIATRGQANKTSSRTRFPQPLTLEELGISYDESSVWRQLAGIPEEDFEENLPVRTGKRTSAKKIIKETRLNPDLVQFRKE